MNEYLPIGVSVLVAVLGGLGGLAAILKVNSDSSNSVAAGSKSVSDGAKTMIDMMIDRMDAQETEWTP